MTTLTETTPKMDLAIQDIEHLVEELRAYHAIYSPLFSDENNGKRRTPISRGCWRRCHASRSSRWC